MIAIAAGGQGLILFVSGNAMASRFASASTSSAVEDTRFTKAGSSRSCCRVAHGRAHRRGIASAGWLIIAQGIDGGLLPIFPSRARLISASGWSCCSASHRLIPALQASRLKIVDALRRQGEVSETGCRKPSPSPRSRSDRSRSGWEPRWSRSSASPAW